MVTEIAPGKRAALRHIRVILFSFGIGMLIQFGIEEIVAGVMPLKGVVIIVIAGLIAAECIILWATMVEIRKKQSGESKS